MLSPNNPKMESTDFLTRSLDSLADELIFTTKLSPVIRWDFLLEWQKAW